MPRKTPVKKFPPILEIPLSRNPYKKKGKVVWGRCYANGVIEIDPRLRPIDFLDTLIHELLHREFPDLRESKVTEAATIMAKELWESDFRRLAK